MKRTFFLFIILFSLCTTFFSQNHKPIHQKIINAYDRIEIDDQETESIEEIKILSDQAKKIGFQQGVLRGLTMLQKIALMQSDYILSGKYSDEAEVLANQLNDNASLSAIYLYRGKINIILDQYPEAEANLNKAVSYGEKIANKADKHIQLCRIYANFAGMYEGLGKSDGWYGFTKKSLNAIETTPTNNLTEYQKSKYYYLYIFELMNMGNYYCFSLKVPKPELAEPYFERLMAFQKSAPEHFKIMEMDAYESMSSFYITKKEYQNAIDYAYKLLEAEKLKSSPRDRLFGFRNLKDSYKFLNNTSQENKYLRLYTTLNDSINAVEKNAVVHQSRKEIKKSNLENEHLTRNLLLFGSALILIITLGAWFYVRNKNKMLRKNYERIIDKLKAETLIPLEETAEVNDVDKKQIEPETGEAELASNRTISTETEARILKRLVTFERSERFLKKDLTIGMLSGQLSTNSKYLSEIIKNHRSHNFNNYINSLRINYIVHKLYNEPKYREYKISYLAEECGYSSSQVFVIAFKKINGVTPSYFIDSLKEDEVVSA